MKSCFYLSLILLVLLHASSCATRRTPVVPLRSVRTDTLQLHTLIQRLVQQGFITGEIKSHFPAEAIVDPNNFVSLLYYFGMVTYGGTHRGNTKLIIPNEVVREQIFAYLLANYHDNDLTYDTII